MGILIEQGGMLTTVQDSGRFGFQQYGVGPAGAMDQRSMRIANLLVGNDMKEAVLEVTIWGPVIRFDEANVVAVTGGDLGVQLNGQGMPMYRAVAVKSGDVLSFSGVKTGCRAYVAFAGGLDIPVVMGSKSTYLRSGFGGYKGRKLSPGDTIGFVAPEAVLPYMETRFVDQEDFSGDDIVVRVIRGPQDDCFTERGYQTFLSETYTVSTESDRMGCRLNGEIIEHVKDGNIISDGVVFGSVQVPSNGLPIIMLADRQTVGGYTKIATVISSDLPLLAQSKPGTKIHFQEVGIEEAQKLYKERYNELLALSGEIGIPCRIGGSIHQYTVLVNGNRYDVIVENLVEN